MTSDRIRIRRFVDGVRVVGSEKLRGDGTLWEFWFDWQQSMTMNEDVCGKIWTMAVKLEIK